MFGRAFRGFWWAFRVLLSISLVLMGFSCLAEHFVGIDGLFVFAEAFRGYWWAFRVWPRLFVGIGGHFVFGRAFRRYWWAFRVWPSIS